MPDRPAQAAVAASQADCLALPEARVRAETAPDRGAPGPDPRALGAADLERGISAFGDPARFVRNLPGAGRANDWETELIVRGGSPDQTGFLVDGVPLARVSHYEGMHGDHGGVGILDLTFADTVRFHAGTFPARLPDRLSGLVEVDYRDGDTTARHERVLTDVSGAGGAAEGPLPGGKGSYAAAARYSTMDLLVRSRIVEGFGVPDYFNGQARAYVPAGNSAFRARIIGGGEDWFNRIGSASSLDMVGHSVASSLSWESREEGGGSRADVRYEERAHRFAFANAYRKPGADPMTRLESGRERRWGASVERSAAPSGGLLLRAGTTAEATAGTYHVRYGDEATYLPYRDTVIQLTQDIGNREAFMADGAGFVEGTWTTGACAWYAGYRHFFEQASRRQAFEPRLAATWRPAPAQSLRAAFGLHTQPHDYADLSHRADPSAARLPYMAQAEAGWEWATARGASLSLEAYAKEGFRLARQALSPSGTGYAEVYRDTGRTRARGLEAGLRSPRDRRWNATLGYSYLWYRERRPDGTWGPGLYSLPHNLNLAAGVSPARGLWVTGRFCAGSGTPYTPFDSAASMRAGTGIYDPARLYSRRGPAYYRVDARLDWEWAVRGARAGLFAEVENVFDRRNESGRQWNVVDGGETPIEGMGRLPVAGISVRF
jgi:hypothetical protein